MEVAVATNSAMAGDYGEKRVRKSYLISSKVRKKPDLPQLLHA